MNGALKPQGDGTKPLDGVIDALANDVSVSYFLLPMPAVKEVEKLRKDPPKKQPKDPLKKTVKTIKKRPHAERFTWNGEPYQRQQTDMFFVQLGPLQL